MEEALAEKLSSICDHHPTINLDLNYHLRLLPISEMAILRLRPYNDSVDIKYQLTVSDILHRPLVRMTEFLRTTLRDVESGALPCAGPEDARSIASFVQDQIHGIAQRVGHFVYQYAHSSHRDDPSWLTRNFPDELTRLSPHIVE
ncbi:MAG: hypothetical protein KDD55_08455 [Bdellovibrionales bacterium]|nr:hypothetical protein [Bdellovibrionales bacterium]